MNSDISQKLLELSVVADRLMDRFDEEREALHELEEKLGQSVIRINRRIDAMDLARLREKWHND